MQQQTPSNFELISERAHNSDHFINEEYTTHINQLISQPATESVYHIAAQYIFSSLFQLSSYLFTKKFKQHQQNYEERETENNLIFSTYLTEMGEELGRFGKIKATRQHAIAKEIINIESQLIKCYQKVDSIYFQQKYFLDFSYFELFYLELKSNNLEKKKKVNRQLDNICESLDMVQINLFSQIHCKFHDYFAAAANFEYLNESVTKQLKKLKESRSRIKRVRSDVVEKSVRLRQKIVHRQNIEKVIKIIKTIRSLKKLPQVMQSILASSLPYQSLELLQQTKSSLQSVKKIKCLTNTSQSIKNMQNLAQNDLTKRYANELYLYLEQCHSKQFINLTEIWKKIQVRNCLDKDNSLIIDELNSSTSSIRSQNQLILQNLNVFEQNQKQSSKTLLKRHEGKQYEIAMILLQSYQYISFSPEVTKMKVCNALRMFSKRFQKELLIYLNEVVRLEIESRKQHEKILDEIDGQKPVAISVSPQIVKKQSQDHEISNDVVQKVTVEFYVKHLGVLNDIFQQTILRFLGYLETLVSEYEQELNNQFKQHKDITAINERHKKFKHIFQQECSLLPSIFKIIEQKIKYLLTLKNISNINCAQFYQWISTLKYWQRHLDNLIEEHPLLNYNSAESEISKPLIGQLSDIVQDNVKKAIAAMGLKNLLYDLTVGYIDAYHNNTLNNEVINTLQQDTWQSTEVPQQFSQILNNILNPDGTVLNASITILDSSNTSNGKLSKQSSRQLSKGDIKDESKVRIKFKLLKNNILIGGIRYKVNLSLIILSETLAQYVKMNRLLSNIFASQFVLQAGYNKISKYVYEKMYNLIEKFVEKSKELILETKALNFNKIKGKSINAKHICLLCNCYSILARIAEEMLDQKKVQLFKMSNTQANTIALLDNTQGMLISKLSLILNSKIEKDISDYILQEKTTPNSVNTNKTNSLIITAFLQMVEITDEYLEIEGIRKVLRQAFQSLSQKYFTHLLLKGQKHRGDVELLAEKLKFLKKYFVLEYEALLRQIPN